MVFVSDGISIEEAKKIGVLVTPEFHETLITALKVHNHTARIGVVTQGVGIMAQIRAAHRRGKS